MVFRAMGLEKMTREIVQNTESRYPQMLTGKRDAIRMRRCSQRERRKPGSQIKKTC
jgi:hypothetical protein